jgi:hypothetical protein
MIGYRQVPVSPAEGGAEGAAECRQTEAEEGEEREKEKARR